MVGGDNPSRGLASYDRGPMEHAPGSVDLGAPPAAAPQPTTFSVGDLTVADPYQWLEASTPDVLAWQAGQNEAAVAFLHSRPGFDRIEAAVERLELEDAVLAPVPAGGRWFGRARRPGDERPILWTGDEPAGSFEVLVDPNPTDSAIDWFYPSPDGELVAYGVSAAGSEESTLRVVRRDGKHLDLTIPYTSAARVAWLPDASGFFYTGGEAPDSERFDLGLWFTTLEGPPVREPLAVEGRIMFAQVSTDGRYVAAIADHLNPRARFVRDLAGDGPWQPLVPDGPGRCYGAFVGDDYIAVVNDDAPRGRLVRIPVASAPDPSSWQELIPAGRSVLRGVRHAGRWLVLTELDEAGSQMSILTLGGDLHARVPLPGPASVSGVGFGPLDPGVVVGDDELVFVLSSFDRSAGLYRHALPDGPTVELVTPHLTLEDVRTTVEHCTSGDGTPLTMFVVRRDDLDDATPHPVLVHAYGGFNVAMTPAFLGPFAAFVEAGGIFVVPHLRGGGEYGRDWWDAGRFERKQNTFNDLYACVEHLVASGIADPGRVALIGDSNGGLLAGVAITQRPDLFAAVIPEVPLLDMLRITGDALTLFVCKLEYGDPTDPDDAAFLAAYSPYHNVREDTPYPACLLLAGETDIRCPPWHARKMTAALQEATTSTEPVLLRVYPSAGHGPGNANHTKRLQVTEELTFLFDRLGLDPQILGG